MGASSKVPSPITTSPVIFILFNSDLIESTAALSAAILSFLPIKKEAAYRKILVIAEDDENVRPKTIDELFTDVRSIHFLSYVRYLYFNVGRMAYLQANVLSAYVFLAPAIVAGVVTLGVMQQIIRAFGRVEGSMQYLLKSWPTIIELASVYKRLREFESQIIEKELIDKKV